MRSHLTHTDSGVRRLRSLALAAALAAGLCALVLALGGGHAAAKTLSERRDSAQSKLEGVRETQNAVADQLAAENREIDTMIGEVSSLRREAAAVAAELAAKEGQLRRATLALRAERDHLEEVRAQLVRSLAVLRERLVAIYESGSPDVINSILESEDMSEMEAQSEYLSRIQGYDDAVVSRVKDLRAQVKGAVARLAENRRTVESARDEIATEESEVKAAEEAAEARFAELKEAQAARRATMESLESREEALSDNLSSISEQIAAQAAARAAEAGVVTEAAGELPPPLTAGETAGFISESEASAPASAPEGVQGAIAAANAIAMTPYIWGGGHGSFESEGYDCSGAVSYALHGGGFLDSPLDSTGLETWGEPGPGKYITVYANAEHAWMMIAGLAFDTVGGPGPRWHSSPVDSPEGFIARHPPGY